MINKVYMSKTKIKFHKFIWYLSNFKNCYEMFHNFFVVEFDCKLVVDSFHSKSKGNSEFHLVSKCKSAMNVFQNSHEFCMEASKSNSSFFNKSF